MLSSGGRSALSRLLMVVLGIPGGPQPGGASPPSSSSPYAVVFYLLLRGHAAPGNQVGKQVSKALDGSWKSTPEVFVIDGWMEFITFVSFSVTVGMRLHNGALSV